MKIEFLPYEPAHLLAFMPGAHSPAEAAACNIEGLTYTCFIDGRICGLAGIVPQWRGRAVAWVLTGGIPLRAWPAITRETLRVIEEAHRRGYRRIEMTARCDCPAALRWAARLGFVRYCALPLYGPDGSDHIGFVRISP